MVKKQIDSRIPTVIRNGTISKSRSIFVIVGDKAKNQLPNLHYLMTCSDIKANKSVLWAYKHKLLDFTSHRKKREAKIKKDIKRGIREPNQEDPFELFISLQNIRYVYYKETENILGNTYGMCILQDFEAITPNLLARTIETVQGGGIIVFLLKTMSSLKQLYSMTMDVHSRYRTEAHNDVVPRFNERFLLSLGSCSNCLVLDDELNVLPISAGKSIKPLISNEDEENDDDDNNNNNNNSSNKQLQTIISSLEGVQPASSLVSLAKTTDQARAILTFIDNIAQKSLRSTVSLTAARGRGKSAAMGISIAAAIAHGYSNIFITSPSPENLKTLFQFIFKAFDALSYEEHLDYDILQSTNPAFNKAIVRVNVFRNHRQTIQYIQPADSRFLGQAELLVIDEAAAIPLPLVKNLLGPYLVFLSSTINGYEGTGRSLSLKLLQQLRQQYKSASSSLDPSLDSKVVDRNNSSSITSTTSSIRSLKEISLEEPIRYAPGDPVEKWLNTLLCLDCTSSPNLSSSSKLRIKNALPHPNECNLYYVNRDTLFSYHPVSEAFLHKMMTLYVASHYKNSPNDLQLMSDAPAHQLYVLLPPVSENNSRLPEPLCVIQIALEGEISKTSVLSSLARGQRAGGDLIPWTVSQQFQDAEFATLSGARVVRIATHPDYINMGYGSRSIQLLIDYFDGKYTSLSEDNFASELTSNEVELKRVSDAEIENRAMSNDKQKGSSLKTDEIKIRDAKLMPPLLLKLSERPPHYLDYIGVSFGLTSQLLKFWKRHKFTPVYLRQTPNELTGEHTAIVLRQLHLNNSDETWLKEFAADFRNRFISLLSYEFHEFPVISGLTIVESAPALNSNTENDDTGLTKKKLYSLFSPFDIKRLESYANNLLDYHVIVDLLPQIAKLYFKKQLVSAESISKKNDSENVNLSAVQSAILLGIGLQHKSLDRIGEELNLPSNQTLAMFSKTIRKVSTFFKSILTSEFEKELPANRSIIAKKNGKVKKITKEDSLDKNNEDEIENLKDEDKEEEEEESYEEVGDEDLDLEDKSKGFIPVKQSLEEDLADGANETTKALREKQRELINSLDLEKYSIDGNDEEWSMVEKQSKKIASGAKGVSGVVSVKKTKEVKESDRKRKAKDIVEEEMSLLEGKKGKKNKKGRNGKK